MSHSRKRNFQNIGTIIAIVISLIALVTSIYEANILKAQQKSMVWPYLSIGTHYSNSGFSAEVYNNGTGPAIVKSMEVRIDSKPVADVFELLDGLKPNHGIGYDILRQNKVNNHVFRPGEGVEMIGFPWNETTRELAKLLNERVQILVCYESVLGESWVYDSKKDEHRKGQFKAKVEYSN